MPITRFVFDILSGIISRTNTQETPPVSNKVEDLISRLITLEGLLGTPAGDVEEQRRREELTKYTIDPPLFDSPLSSFQEAPLHRRRVPVVLPEAANAATSR